MVPSGKSRNGPYKRILLKLSGEALAGDAGYGIDTDVLKVIAAEIKETWSQLIEPIARRCKLASSLNCGVSFNAQGSEALGSLLTGMAERLDAVVQPVRSRGLDPRPGCRGVELVALGPVSLPERRGVADLQGDVARVRPAGIRRMQTV